MKPLWVQIRTCSAKTTRRLRAGLNVSAKIVFRKAASDAETLTKYTRISWLELQFKRIRGLEVRNLEGRGGDEGTSPRKKRGVYFLNK